LYRYSYSPYPWPSQQNWNSYAWGYAWNPYAYNWNAEFQNHYRTPAERIIELKDYGPQPFVVNLEEAAEQNNYFRTALWTGKHFQVTLMSINVGDDIGLEVHPSTDQLIRIEEGQGLVQMGDTRENLNFRRAAHEGDAILIPAGKWHNVTNTGHRPLKVSIVYAPPEHPFGTVHRTKAEAMAAEQVGR